jgi:hypothetical protein
MLQISNNAGLDQRGALGSYSRRAIPRLRHQERELRTIARPALPKRRCISKQAAFLAAFRKTASVTAAAEAAGITPDRHQRWLEEDPRYWEAFMDAHLEVTDALKGEVIARAIRHHDVRLLVNLLKAWMPEKYR